MARLLALVFALALAAPAAAQPAAAPPSLYVCLYREGPKWQAGKPMSAQGLAPHGAYMRKLFAEGRLLAGGPLPDLNGGMAIVRAASLEDARQIFAVDPAVTGGVFTCDVQRWAPVFDAKKLAAP